MRPNQLLSLAVAAAMVACKAEPTPAPSSDPAVAPAGQAAVQDNQSTPDVVKVAAGSPDHTTLVKALQAADLVNSLANAGPFTVFAPTNAAFDKLPAGTLDNLMKPANKDLLAGVLQHHVTTSAQSIDDFATGDTVAMADGNKEVVQKDGKAMWIGTAKVIASVRASNGWVHIIDAVLVPAPTPKP